MRISQCLKWGSIVSKRDPLIWISSALLVGGQLTSPAMPNVWINEFHYDNDGTDISEMIEVAGPAGTVLDGFQLILYNGLNGAPYQTISLSGLLPNQENGFGTLAFAATSGIQNGAPDGLALVDATSSVIQFLSYEGSFTGVGGPADGISSVDVLVAEATDTPAGFSLQLVGSGSSYMDFTWADPSTDSFGSVNSQQHFQYSEPPSNPVPDGGSSLTLFGLVFLGLIWRPSSGQGGKDQLEDRHLG